MQAKLKYMGQRKVDHIIIIASLDSTMASRKMAANSPLITTFIYLFQFSLYCGREAS